MFYGCVCVCAFYLCVCISVWRNILLFEYEECLGGETSNIVAAVLVAILKINIRNRNHTDLQIFRVCT